MRLDSMVKSKKIFFFFLRSSITISSYFLRWQFSSILICSAQKLIFTDLTVFLTVTLTTFLSSWKLWMFLSSISSTTPITSTTSTSLSSVTLMYCDGSWSKWNQYRDINDAYGYWLILLIVYYLSFNLRL